MNDWWERLSSRDDPGNRGWKAAPTAYIRYMTLQNFFHD
jgi:hypothetical protein